MCDFKAVLRHTPYVVSRGRSAGFDIKSGAEVLDAIMKYVAGLGKLTLSWYVLLFMLWTAMFTSTDRVRIEPNNRTFIDRCATGTILKVVFRATHNHCG